MSLGRCGSTAVTLSSTWSSGETCRRRRHLDWVKKSEKVEIRGMEASHARNCQKFTMVSAKCKAVGSGKRCGLSGTMRPSREGPCIGNQKVWILFA